MPVTKQLTVSRTLPLLFCLVIGIAAQSAKASLGFQPISQDELKMTSEPQAPGAPAIILFREVDRDDDRTTAHEDDYLRIKILTEEGRKYANIEIAFVKGEDKIGKIRARIIKPSGSIADFDGKVFEKELVKGRGTKVLAKTFTLPDVAVGDIIEYFYAVDFSEHMLFDSHWILSDELFTKKAQFSLKPYKNTYATYSLRWSWHELPPGAEPKEGSGHVIRMEANNIPAFQTEDYMPPPNELKSRVDFIYELIGADKDQNNFWRRLGKDWNEQLENFVGKPKTMVPMVSEIVSPDDSEDMKLQKIYRRVQKIRNTTFEPQKTEQEEKRDKEKPAENIEAVWKRGYGDGDQLTWLFLGLARAAGFDAYGCWVSDRREYFFNAATMQSAELNSNVVLVKLNGKDLYLDPGAAFTPFGMLPWWETGVPGLRLDKDGGTWIRTTLPPASETRTERLGMLRLTESGDLEGKLTLSYFGLEAIFHRMEESNADESSRRKYLEERVTSEIGVPAEAELTNRPDWASSDTPLIAEFDLKIRDWVSSSGNKVILPAAVFTAGEKDLFQQERRVHPIYFTYPYEESDDLTIALPSGWRVSDIPPPRDQNGKVVMYSLAVENGPGTLRLTRRLTISALLIEQKYYGAVRTFFQNVRTSDGSQIVAVPGEIHASN